MKRIINWSLILVSLLILIYVATEVFLGGINIKETLDTKYDESNNSQTIETNQFKIATPTNWIHIFRGYGNEGNACGSFWTDKGIISYDYGIFTNNYETDSTSVFSSDSIQANRFIVIVGKNLKNEIGIYIPRQHEMEWSFSFYMSEACALNYDDLLLGISTMEFKKTYYGLKTPAIIK